MGKKKKKKKSTPIRRSHVKDLVFFFSSYLMMFAVSLPSIVRQAWNQLGGGG